MKLISYDLIKKIIFLRTNQKVWLIIPLMLISIKNIHSAQEKYVRGVNSWGLQADFLWTLNHLEFCVANNKIPVIYWGKEFAYFSPEGYNGSKNGWEYYFEPVSTEIYVPGDKLYTTSCYPRSNNFSTAWWYCQYIDNKHKLSPEQQLAFKSIQNHEAIYASSQFDGQRKNPFPVGAYHLYDKQFRSIVKTQLIDRFIKIKPSITKKIEGFYESFIAHKKTIGIHLRGQHIWKEVLFVPLEYIFEEANKYADLGYQFFIATDQYPLLEEARKHLRGNVIFYDCERFDQTTSPDGTFKLDPKLGEDVLIETLLLSRCDRLIHTLSNVSTAALYFNPNISHTLIY